MDALVFFEMEDCLADRISVALADVGNENSSGGIRIVWVIRYYGLISIKAELCCPVTKCKVGKGTMIEECIIERNVKVKITVGIHKKTVVIRKQKIA